MNHSILYNNYFFTIKTNEVLKYDDYIYFMFKIVLQMNNVGFSKDIHRISLDKGKSLLLANYLIPTKYKIIAESDGDIVLHSISEAILGGIGLRDIGFYFNKIMNIKSIDILTFSLKQMKKNNMAINNIDILIEVNEIKLCNYYEFLIKELSNCLQIANNKIGLKFTTNENTYNNVIICYSIVSLVKL